MGIVIEAPRKGAQVPISRPQAYQSLYAVVSKERDRRHSRNARKRASRKLRGR